MITKFGQSLKFDKVFLILNGSMLETEVVRHFNNLDKELVNLLEPRLLAKVIYQLQEEFQRGERVGNYQFKVQEER